MLMTKLEVLDDSADDRAVSLWKHSSPTVQANPLADFRSHLEAEHCLDQLGVCCAEHWLNTFSEGTPGHLEPFSAVVCISRSSAESHYLFRSDQHNTIHVDDLSTLRSCDLFFRDPS